MAALINYLVQLSVARSQVARFRSDEGDEFVVTLELGLSRPGSYNVHVTVECGSSSKYLITAEIFTKGVSVGKRSLLPGEDRRNVLVFPNVAMKAQSSCECIIQAIPKLELHDVQSSTALPRPETATEEKTEIIAKLEDLSHNFGNLLLSGHLSDVVLTNGDIRIHAHKVILSARSPVFGRMFLLPMKENKESCVHIPDISADVLKELVSFVYSGVVTVVSTKMARALYMVADRYDIAELKSVCSLVLKGTNCDDVLETLALADLYHDKQLKESLLNFICQNYSTIKASDAWKVFLSENLELTVEVLNFIIEHNDLK